MGGEGLGDSRKEEDLHVGGWDYLVVRVVGGVPVYLIYVTCIYACILIPVYI